jgi:hypothetical protein
MRLAVALVMLLSLGSDVWAFVAVNHPYTALGGDFIIKIAPYSVYDSSVSEAGQAGPTQMRVGDRLSAASLTFDQRLQIYGYETIRSNDRLHLNVSRNGTVVPLDLSPISIRYITGQLQFNTNLSILTSVIILAIGLALVMLRPSPMTFGFFLFCATPSQYAFGPTILPGFVNFGLQVAFLILSTACAPWGFAQFCLRFPDGQLTPVRARVSRVLAVVLGITAAGAVFRLSAGVLYPLSSVPYAVLNDDRPWLYWASNAAFYAAVAIGIVALVLRYRTLQAKDRLKTRAILVAMLIVGAYWLIGVIQSFLPYTHKITFYADLLAWLGLVTVILPATVLYAVVRYRLFDIEFVINRAAVFTVVSLLIVGAFILVEWLLGGWLSTAGHVTNGLVGAALAVLLGFTVRSVHGHVERVVDRVFFRRRHEGEEAIRRFAHEAAYFTDPSALLARAKETLETKAAAPLVTFALRDGNDRYGGVDENDPAIVSLRTWHKKLNLHEVATGLPGDVAFPMVAQGRLVGVLSLGAKPSGESYAPDESDAIAELAQSVGIALDGFSKGTSTSKLLDAILALPDAIAARFRDPRLPS